jgi:hypothetical protein
MNYYIYSSEIPIDIKENVEEHFERKLTEAYPNNRCKVMIIPHNLGSTGNIDTINLLKCIILH